MNPGLDTRRAWLMWGIGLVAYIVSMMQRTSFGIAAIQAGERFGVGASVVGVFVVLQLLTYTALQIPAGLLADRIGSRLVISLGAALMALGQLDLAFAGTLASAMFARVLVGAGAALTFTSVIRLLPFWFSARRIPLLTQLTGMSGQAGQLLSSIPLANVLVASGWTTAFTTASAASGVACLLVLSFLRNGPRGVRVTPRRRAVGVRGQVVEALGKPAARLGFWIHWTSGFWSILFGFMWGYPFLLAGEGCSPAVASALFGVYALATALFAPLAGLLSQRIPQHRAALALCAASLSAAPWLAVLLWPGACPIWLLVGLMVGLAASGPGATIGFDVARSGSPSHSMATVLAVAVSGGFLAAILDILVVGLVLDALGGYSIAHFKWAMATQFIVLAVGVLGIVRSRFSPLDVPTARA